MSDYCVKNKVLPQIRFSRVRLNHSLWMLAFVQAVTASFSMFFSLISSQFVKFSSLAGLAVEFHFPMGLVDMFIRSYRSFVVMSGWISAVLRPRWELKVMGNWSAVYSVGVWARIAWLELSPFDPGSVRLCSLPALSFFCLTSSTGNLTKLAGRRKVE